MRLARLLVAGCLGLVAAACLAQVPLPPGVTRVTAVEGITEYRLENGLKVLLFPDLSKPTITVNITYLVGSRHENYGETGMAHLLEHLVFKGTPRNPDIDKQFNQRGARSNGTTWLDRTNYYELFQASDDNLKWALEMEADRMVNSFIRKADLSTEMTVVRNEFESGENSPFGVMLKRLQSIAYDWHSYGRSTIGNRSDIENVREENLRAFYRTYYQPDNAVLLVAGRFEEATALAMVASAFGPIPRPSRELPAFWTVEPVQDGEREFRVRRKGETQIVMVAYKIPSGLHPDSDSVSVGDFVLGDTPTGRLHKALVETGKAAQVFSYGVTGLHPGLQLFGAVMKKGEPPEPVRDEIVRIVEGLAGKAPSAEELARAKKNFENQFEKTLADHESIGVQLSEYIALGDWRLFFHARDQLAKVSAESVAAAAGAYLRRDNRTVGYFVPEDAPRRAQIPAAPAVADVMRDFKGRAATTASEAFDPSQENIDARTRRFVAGGLKVALLPKKNRGETVHVSLRLNLGDEKSLFGQRTAAEFAGAMLSRGTTKLTRTQIADAMERLKMSGSVGGTGAAFQTTREHLAQALELAAHVLREPSFPEAEFEQLRAQTVTGIQSRLPEPNARASEALGRHFNPWPKGDWRYQPTLEEQLQLAREVKLEDAKRFHREFYGAQAAELAIVGDFDEERAASLAGSLFAGWKAGRAFAHVPSAHRAAPAADLRIETPDKENAILLARQAIDLRDDEPDYPALYLANYILGGDAGLDSRLGKRLRQQEGLSYGAGSSLSVPSIDRTAQWSAYAIVAPQNMARLEAAFREELARALKDGFTEAEVANARSGALQQRVQTRAQDGSLAAGWAYNLHVGRTFAFSKRFEERLRAATAADVNAALRKYLDPARVTVVKAGDFAGKAK